MRELFQVKVLNNSEYTFPIKSPQNFSPIKFLIKSVKTPKNGSQDLSLNV